MNESAELGFGLQTLKQEVRTLVLDRGSSSLPPLSDRDGRFRPEQQTIALQLTESQLREAEQGSSKEDQPKGPISFGSDVTEAGKPDPDPEPTDAHLRAYFACFAPGHGAIRGMRFAEAAALYRWLAAGAISARLRSRYLTIARQLDLTQQMKHVSHGSISFPPTGEEVECYFRALGTLALDEIQSAFEGYVDSFFVLSQVLSSGQDVSIALEGTEPEWCTQIPAAWEFIQSGRLLNEGRRTLDPVGHALLGKKCLEAAGFSGGHFAVASRRMALSHGDSLSTCLMFTASRVTRENRRWSEEPHIEVVVVADGSLRWAAAVSAIDVEAAEEVLLWSAFQEALDVPLDQSGRIAQERVVRLGNRGYHLGGIGGGATAVRVFMCHPSQQASIP